jgi:hypothetical protein
VCTGHDHGIEDSLPPGHISAAQISLKYSIAATNEKESASTLDNSCKDGPLQRVPRNIEDVSARTLIFTFD